MSSTSCFLHDEVMVQLKGATVQLTHMAADSMSSLLENVSVKSA